MDKEQLGKRLFTRRAMILATCKATLFAGLFGRMFYLQIISNREFSKLSENNRIKIEIIPALRGRILDRNNNELASNKQSYQLVFEKLEIHNKQNIYDAIIQIGKILKYDSKRMEGLNNDLTNLTLAKSIVIEESLTWSQLESIELRLYDLPGISIEVGFERFYPHGSLCSHITGYMGTISDKESANSSFILYPNIKIGKNGIEKTQENLLHGTSGEKRIEVNAKGQIIRDLSASESLAGQDVHLTIDLKLQQKANALLGNATGVVLLAKIDNGEILAAVSKPDFDSNLFNHGISVTNWNNLINNPELPLIDRSVALTYPPGSGFKINVAIAALKEKFNPETKFSCPGHYVLGNRTFHCWNKHGHGSINLYQAIAGSCNVYFWNIAKIIGIQPIIDIARMMGYGKKLLNGTLPREQAGLIPDPSWKKKNIGTNWTLADTINASIGQGYVEATPMQMLTMIARIASGKEFTPTIIKRSEEADFPSLGLINELNITRKGMEMTANNTIGTAYANRIINPELAMAGKTGTAQVISKRHADDDLSRENVLKKIRNHGIFVSYAPLINPKYAFCGIIEHGGFPTLAVKIAKELLTEAQTQNKI
jgi:penicillin-binding protein 2